MSNYKIGLYILLFIENKKTPDEVREMLKNGEISYNITAKDLTKKLKPAKGQDLAELGGTAEVTSEEKAENAEESTPNEKVIENVKKCNQYTRGCRMIADMLAKNMAYMDTEKYAVKVTFEKL